MLKNLYKPQLTVQSNKYGAQLHIQLGARRELSHQKNYFHRLECDSTRNNILPNNKQKPKPTSLSTGVGTDNFFGVRRIFAQISTNLP